MCSISGRTVVLGPVSVQRQMFLPNDRSYDEYHATGLFVMLLADLDIRVIDERTVSDFNTEIDIVPEASTSGTITTILGR